MRTVTGRQYSPDPEVDSAAINLPADVTLSIRVVQTNAPVPFGLHEFPREPPSNEPWEDCFVPAHLLDTLWMRNDDHLPIYCEGKTSDGRHYKVVATRSYTKLFRQRGLFTEIDVEEIAPWEPTDSAVRVHGKSEAKRKAQRCFINNTIEGIISKGNGLLQYYRHTLCDNYLMVPIEWALLIHDILADLGLSADDNLILFNQLLSLDVTEPAPKRATTREVVEVLLPHKPFGCNEEDMTTLWKTFGNVPVGFSPELYEILPADLINAVPYNTVTDVQQ
ncbi:hypothetical protein AK830_g180 [Neonectria ditissima]|uniref:Uncharacterized protein n=1 Tax=Neonectria ditissima TaxID=78410 RepID=A0A0P7BM23_9HYPO|nr:hypothetical protein AK830_g180 [Neonectria ditissima]